MTDPAARVVLLRFFLDLALVLALLYLLAWLLYGAARAVAGR